MKTRGSRIILSCLWPDVTKGKYAFDFEREGLDKDRFVISPPDTCYVSIASCGFSLNWLRSVMTISSDTLEYNRAGVHSHKCLEVDQESN